MNTQPLIAVHDVEASSRWYQRLLDCQSGHGGAEYERLTWNDTLLLQLHRWDTSEHPHMGDSSLRPYGNGALLFFETESFDAAVLRARDLEAEVLEEPHVNPNARRRECWLRDPDGYVIILASPHGEIG